MNNDSLNIKQATFNPGDIVAQRFEIIKPLRSGCQGAIYLVRHLDFPERLIAMKVLLVSSDEDFETTAARFRNEVMAAYSVTHPNIVRIFDYIRQGSLLAFTMEYIIGGDLADLLAYEEPLKIYQIVHILEQVCQGLSSIHSAKIIHRDIKPENILITQEGHVKISDFGTARIGSTLGKKNGITGTVGYLSPEYIREGHLDSRSDLYSLGVVAYEMIAGEVPFQGNNLLESISERLESSPPSVLEKNDKCPEKLAKIVDKLLQLNPDNTYQSADDALMDLSKVRVRKMSAQGKENTKRTQVLDIEKLQEDYSNQFQDNENIEIEGLKIPETSTKEFLNNDVSEEILSTRIDLEIEPENNVAWKDTVIEYVRPPVTYWQYFLLGIIIIAGFGIGLVASGMH